MKLMTIVIVKIAIMTSVASAAVQIDGSTITATTQGTWHITEASAMVNTTREVGEQYMAPRWDATPFPLMYGAADFDDGWLLFDLGADYDLAEIRLWNGSVSHSDNAFRDEWYARNISIHVAGAGAVLPSMDPGLGNYFTDPSWTNIWDSDVDGDLAQGPLNTALAQDQLVDPQLTLDATAYTGIRYVAIDHDSNYAGNATPTLLGHIQIDQVPEPTTLGLLGLGLGGLFLRRRKR